MSSGSGGARCPIPGRPPPRTCPAGSAPRSRRPGPSRPAAPRQARMKTPNSARITPTWRGSTRRSSTTAGGTACDKRPAIGDDRRGSSGAPVPGNGLRDWRSAGDLVLRRYPAAGGGVSSRGQRCRRAARHPVHHLLGVCLDALPQAPAGDEADRDHAAGRHHPDHDVHRRAMGHPPVHQPRADRPGPADRAGRPLTEHYFSPRPQASHRPGQVRVVLPDVYLELATDAGVFSPGRLDPGTRLLLEEAPAPPAAGDLLDLGCGYGPVACVLAKRSPDATVWAVDVNERALELCARNARAAGLENVRCVTPGDASPPERFAAIWSNPPVRIGKDALHALLGQWLARLGPGASGSPAASGGSARPAASGGSARPAASGGSAYLVVGRNLGADSLHRWLAEQGWPVTRLAARSGYRLLEVDFPAERAEVTRP